VIGKPFELRARWAGPIPSIGEYLASSPERARFAYRIIAVRGCGARLTLTVERFWLEELPPGALVHSWHWDRRCRGEAHH